MRSSQSRHKNYSESKSDKQTKSKLAITWDVNSATPPLQWIVADLRISTSRGQLGTCRCKKTLRAIIYLLPPKTAFFKRRIMCIVSERRLRSKFDRPMDTSPAGSRHAWRVVDSTSLPHEATRSRIVCPLHRRWKIHTSIQTMCCMIWLNVNWQRSSLF